MVARWRQATLLLPLAVAGVVHWVRGPQPDLNPPPTGATEQAGELLSATASWLSGAAPPSLELEGDWYVTVYSQDGRLRRSVAVGEGAWSEPLRKAWPGNMQVDLAVPDPPSARPGPWGMGLDVGLDGWLTDDGGVHLPVTFLLDGKERGELAEFLRSHPGQPLRTWSWVLGPEGPLRLQRATVDPGELSPELLRERIRLAADYLAGHLGPDGRFDYSWLSRRGKAGGGYNIVRHAGAAYSLFQAHGVSGDPLHYEAGLSALGYLDTATQHSPDGRCFVVAGDWVKLGASGLTLLALVEQARVHPDEAQPERMRCLAEHIVANQEEGGELHSYSTEGGRYEDPGGQVAFYSGEALLALLRYSELDPDPRWLDTVTRGTDYLIHERWEALGLRIRVPADAWQAQLLAGLWRRVPDPEYAEHAFAVGTALMAWQLGPSAPEDVQGGTVTSGFPQTIGAGARAEGLAALAALEAELRPGERRFLDQTRLTVGFSLRHQYTPPMMLGLRRPERSLGGFREAADDGQIRIDGVQHNISGLVGLLRLMESSP